MSEIKNNNVEEIKRSVSIADVLQYCKLIPTNAGFIQSIYKNEKNPSLKIYFDTNTFKCYSSGKSGDQIQLFKDFNNFDFPTAINKLGELTGLKKESFQKSPANDIRKHYKTLKIDKRNIQFTEFEKDLFEERAAIFEFGSNILREIAEEYAHQIIIERRKKIQVEVYAALEQYCAGLDEVCYEYLTGPQRNLTPETIKKFRFFNIKNPKDTIVFLKDNFNSEELLISGLFNSKDRFVFHNHRLIIPFLEDNRIIFLRGRSIGSNGESSPVGQNSKYISLCNFAGNLTVKRFFNIDVLKRAVKDECIFILEGEFDTMVASQSGYKAIGILGTGSFPTSQLNLLYDKEIYLIMDNDEAGQNAVLRITRLFDRPIKTIKIKNGKDLSEVLQYA